TYSRHTGIKMGRQGITVLYRLNDLLINGIRMGDGGQYVFLSEITAELHRPLQFRCRAPTPNMIGPIQNIHIFHWVRISNITGILGAPLTLGKIRPFQVKAYKFGPVSTLAIGLSV